MFSAAANLQVELSVLGNEVDDKVHNFFEQDNLSKGQHYFCGKQWVALFRNATWLRYCMIVTTPELRVRQSGNQHLSLNGSFLHEQQGHAGQYRGELRGGTQSFLAKNLKQSEIDHMSFNFFGGQQQITRAPQPGMPLHGPRLQMGVTDMHAWQQKIMYNQLQDIQRQRQLDQESRELNRMNQLSATSNQSTGDLLPRLGNELHIHNASSNFRLAEHMRGDSKVPTTSEMPMVSNTNWYQNGGSSAAQRYPAGLISSFEQGQAPHSTGFVPDQLDQSLYGTPIASVWGGLSQYSNIPADMLTKVNASADGYHWKQQQADWPENTQENNGLDASSGGSSTVTGGYEPFDGFSTMQSGTWSALMQSAVAETSSNDTGIQDEWSGLSSHTTQMPTGALDATMCGSSKQRKDWGDQNMNHVSSVTSRPLQLFDDSTMDRSGDSASREYAGQPPGGSIKWLNHSSEHMPHTLAEDSYPVQPHMHPEKSAGAAWPGPIYEESKNAAHFGDIGLNAQNMDGFWIQGHTFPSDNTENQIRNRQNGLSMREIPSANGFVSLTVLENNSTMQRESSYMRKSTAGPNSDLGNVNQPANLQVQNNNHIKFGNHVDSLVKYRGDDTTTNCQNQGNNKEISNESYNSNRSHQIIPDGPRETLLSSPSDSRSLGKGNKKFMSQVGRKVYGVRKFQYHPMGVLAANVEPVDKRVQNLSQHVSGGSRGIGQGYSGYGNSAQIPSSRGHWDSKSGISGEANETLQQKMPAGTYTGTLPYQRHQLQHQQVHHSQLTGSQLRIPAPPLSVLESTPVSRPSASLGVSLGSFPMTSKNSSSLQCGGSSALSINTSNRNMGRTSWVQKQDYQGTKKMGDLKHYANGEEQTGKKSSLQEVHLGRDTSSASRGQESSEKHLLDANSIASDSLAVPPHHQSLDIRCGKDPILVPLTEYVSLQNQSSSNSGFEACGQSLKQARVPQQNLSLPLQLQNIEHTETDPDVSSAKRFKRSDAGPVTQQIATLRPDQQPFDGGKISVKYYGSNEVIVTAMQKSVLSENDRVHNCSSEVREDTNSAQHFPEDLPSQDVSAFSGRKKLQDCSDHHNFTSTKPGNTQISPQMAPSWFEQYGAYKNGKMLLVNNIRKLEESKGSLLPANSSESLNTPIMIEPANVFHTSQGIAPTSVASERVSPSHSLRTCYTPIAIEPANVSHTSQSIATTSAANEHVSPPRSLPSQVTDQSLSVMKPKKRKSEGLDLLPWHKEVMRGSQRLLNIRMAEKDWAHTTHRLLEKVEDEVEMVEDGQQILLPRRRLILTTKLMQQLLRPPPPAILSADATSSYESVVYIIAKVALEDACSMVPSTGSDLSSTVDNRNQIPGELKLSERLGDKYSSKSKIIKDFTGRAKKLELDLLRWEKTCSVLDIRVECQELEKISVINGFAKFHTRAQPDSAENSISTTSQRYVISLLMPRNLPHGVPCLSL
ncbi:uncharacterized protein LOC113296405 [Papaver somniferum]|uniref:uncharacterized protein LOC113296405 n=1 Tax=Papaver somniferum TaxID=3469 RepID=UPI000E7014D6|nr:uncharacterized protein LOC113296405 [Papaver somniferum]